MGNNTKKKKRTYKKPERNLQKIRQNRIYIGGSIPEKCIFLRFLDNEGLGMLLFMYAAGLTAKKKTNLPLCLLGANKKLHSDIDYRTFMEGKSVNEEDVKMRLSEAKPIFTKRSNGNPKTFTAKWSNTNIEYNKDENKNLKMTDAYYQNYSSVKAVIPDVKMSLIKNEFHKESYKQVKNIFTDSSHTAFMHVRRGDYGMHGRYLPIDYYHTALTKLENNETIKHVYIMSNDMAWCKQHEADWKKFFTKNIHYFDNSNELETLYAMMLCEGGAIIANSSFSCWGAMIGADMNEKSMIIYPSPWIKELGTDPNLLSFPKRWHPVKNSSIPTNP